MAKKGNRIKVKLKSTKSGYYVTTTKNRINDQNEKLKLKKFDPIVGSHVEFEEKKLK